MTRVIENLDQASAVIGDRATVCCIGVFDGVHIGHQRLIGEAVAEGRRRRRRSVVFTFRNHPLSVLAPAYAPPLLTDAEEKVRRIAALSPSLICMVAFSRNLATMEPEAFFEEVLVKRLRGASLWCGSDFRFGRDGRGDLGLLEELGGKHAVGVRTVPPVCLHGHAVSSTLIRALLEQGQVEQARECLGRCHVVAGRVVHGHGRGRQLKFPTANIEPPADITIPEDGIYAVWVDARGRRFGGMMNLGPSPTFGVSERRLEVHLLDFDDDLAGETIAIHFVARLRDIRRFDSAETLVEQMRADKRHTLRVLKAAKDQQDDE